MVLSMLKKDVLAYFDPIESKPSATARALNITPGAVSQWDDVLPELMARRIHDRTRGKLRFRPEAYGLAPARSTARSQA